jgi:MFS family permease
MMTAKNTHSKKELIWGRTAAKTIYFMLGIGSGIFAANIPRVKETLHLSTGSLGLALFFFSIGGFVAMQFTAPLIKKIGLRLLLMILAPLFPLGLIFIGMAQGFGGLVAAMILYGGLTSVVAIAINAHAIDIENAYAKAIMSSFHALYSIGALGGAMIGGVFAAQHLSVVQSLTIIAVSLSLLGILLMTKLFDVTKYDSVEDHEVTAAVHTHHKARWWRWVLLIGGLMFICSLCEGAIGDWGAIYMKSEHGAGPLIAVFAYVLFNAFMTIGRLTGDVVIRRFGSMPILIVGGIMGACGLSIGLLSSNLIIALGGFGLIGLGLSVLVPILISMAGNLVGGDRNVAIARASTCGSIGSMAGPAIIGFVAQLNGLLLAMLIPVALLVVLTITGTLIHKSARTTYTNLGIVS